MEEEDGELFKTEISFTGMPGKLLVSGKKVETFFYVASLGCLNQV